MFFISFFVDILSIFCRYSNHYWFGFNPTFHIVGLDLLRFSPKVGLDLKISFIFFLLVFENIRPIACCAYLLPLLVVRVRICCKRDVLLVLVFYLILTDEPFYGEAKIGQKLLHEGEF